MAKVKTVFFCKNCGGESPKWIGKCPSCNEWNTYVEEIISKSSTGKLPDVLGFTTDRVPKALHTIDS